jgi:YHS domain-containing protein
VLLRLFLLGVLFVVIARTFWRFFDAVVRGATVSTPGAQAGRGKAAPVKMQQCPVCSTYVVPGKAISATSGGATVYFCSEKCRAEYPVR